jgi:hypothetical protein
MPDFFHVNHSCPDYFEGHVIELFAMDWSENPSMEAVFRNGLSAFGIRHVFPDNPFGRVSDETMELEAECERVRQEFYPLKPSRLQSVFAVATLDEARVFRLRPDAVNKPCDNEIWTVEAAAVGHQGDMRLIDPAHRDERTLRNYWEGLPKDELPPTWELLLQPPVTLVRRVE